jgi:transposase-like protein
METVAGWRELLGVEDPAARNALARAFLTEVRWPDGASCPRCASTRVVPVRSRSQLDCRACRYRFSVTAGTVFHDSNLPLWKWLVAVSLLVESEDGLPAQRLARTIGVSYKTAWSIGHRVRTVFAEQVPVGGDDPRRFAPTYHVVSEKYLPAYRAELEWREQNRENPEAFLDAVRALLAAPQHERQH